MPRDRLRQGERSTAGAVKVDPVNLYEFQKSWYHLKLSHSHLNAFVKYAEAAGLGSASEILLCMVPALSFNDLLPNEKMLSLMPLEFQHIQGYGWAQTASFYHDLLSLIVAEIEEYFALAAVVQAMEFVYFASEPFTKDIKPEPELDIALNKLVARLSGDFPNILKNLSPVYSLQGRRKSFEAVFHHYANYGECRVNKIEFPRWNSDENEEQKDFREKAGVTSVHIQVCDATKSNKSSDLPFNDVVKADIFGWTVVHYAATGSNQGVLEPVLKSARNNSQPIHRCLDKFKRSPIHVAALSTKESVLKKLLEEVKNMNGETVVSAAVNAKGLDGMTPIHLAAKGKHVGCLKTLLEHDRRTEVDVWGRHPIHLAAVAPLNLEIAKHLLDHGSQPDQLDTFERTPLTYLRHPREQEGVSNPGYSQKKMADELMRRWKRYDAKDCNGKAMLHYAIEFLDDSLDNRKIERYENFLKRGAAVDVADNNGCTPLHLAVLKKKEAEVDVLLRYGAKPSAENYRGETPLMLACQTGQARVFHSLLDKILDPQDKQAALDKKDNEGKTALHYVAACRLFSGGNLDRVVAAFEKNIDIRSQDGRTALHTAIIASNKSTALKLLDHGAKSGIAYKDGQVALHFVSRADKLDSDEAKDLINALIVAWEKEEIPQILSEKINARDDYGRTPLHEAILADNDIVAHALICLGADHAIKDSAGWTPLISAAAVGYCLEIVKLIVRNGNEEIVNQGDSYSDKSPIAYACEYGHLETVKCLLNALKVDPNRPATGKDNYTPLHLALGGKHVAVVNVLLDNPRVVPDWDGIGKTLLEHAKAEYYDCIEAILLHPRTPTAIRESIAKLGYSSTS